MSLLSAILYVETVDDDLVALVEACPEIADAEVRREEEGRLALGADEWINLLLVVIFDFDDVSINRFKSNSGA